MQTLINLLSRFKKNRNLYWVVFGQLSNAFLSLILLKIFANILKPESYGDYNLLMQFINLIISFFSTQLLTSFFKYINDIKYQKDTVYLYFNRIVLLVNLPSSLAMLIYCIISNLPLFTFFISLCFIIISNLNAYFRNIIYMKSMQKENAISLMLQNSFSIIIILLINQLYTISTETIITCMTLAQIPSLIYNHANVKHKTDWTKIIRYNYDLKSLNSDIFKYILPLLGLSLFSWINNASSRYVLKHYMDSYSVGIFAAGFTIGSQIFLLLIGTLAMYFRPILYTQSCYPHKFKKIEQRYFFIYLISALIVLLIVFLFTNLIGSTLLSQNYKESFPIIFLTSIAYSVLGIAYVLEVFFYTNGSTGALLIHNLVGAIINLPASILLIPIFNVYGAVYAIIASSIVQVIVIIYFRYSLTSKTSHSLCL